jgi:hypothetical protein
MKKILLSAVLAASSWALFAQDTTNRTNSTMNSNTTTNQQMNTSTNQNTNVNTNTSNQVYNTSTTSNYSAYGVPNYVQMNFQSQHPNASNLTWTASTADWYHGYYSDPTSGRYTHVYYSTDPYYNVQYYPERITGYTVSLPVLETWVPDAVVTTAINQYKQNLYDITAMKGNDSTDMYLVRVMDNGQLKTMYMDANGAAVTNIYRTEEQMNMSNVNSANSTDTNAAMDNSSTTTTDMNNTNTNVKTKTKTTMDDGSQIKTKTKNGKTTTKKNSSTNNNDQY